MAVAAVWQAGGEGEWGGVRCSSRRSWRRKANDGGWREERQARGGAASASGNAVSARLPRARVAARAVGIRCAFGILCHAMVGVLPFFWWWEFWVRAPGSRRQG